MKRLPVICAFVALLTIVLVPAANPQQPAVDELKKEAISQVESMQNMTQQMVDQVFSFSELGFQEFETSKYLTGVLENNGFHVERGISGIPTAWVATYGSGKPVIAFITDIDCIPQASQKPGVAYHDPIVAGAPGHGEGHNSGEAVNITAAIVLKKMMEEHHIAGTLKLFPGVAEELLGTKAFYVRSGYFRDVDIVLGVHVGSEFATSYGQGNTSGLVSVQYSFHGRAAHAAADPWDGHSALAAVELMDVGWDFRREYLRVQQRSHHVIFNGGDQPNVVPPEAGDWWYFREMDYPHIKELYDLGNTMADAAAMMSSTTVNRRLVGSAWPPHFNKAIAEDEMKNIQAVGMPHWTDDDQTLAKALQKEVGKPVNGLHTEVTQLKAPVEPTNGGASDDVGDISWNVPMVYMRYPANIPEVAGHSWESAVAMATPIAHKGSTAGAKVQATTAIDFLTNPALVQQAWDYFRNVQTKDMKYTSFLGPDDKPAIELNKDKMERYLPQLRKYYFDPAKYKTYLEQLGIRYPTVKTAIAPAQ